jgi:universal stress protein A
MKIQKILCPVDFSTHSQPALAYAKALARAFNGSVTIMHVAPDLLPIPMAEVGYAPIELEAEFQSSKERLDKIECEGVDCKKHLTQGFPAEEIVRFAKQENFDLIVMPTHGRTGLKRLLMGSVAEHVMRESPCPVLAVKVHVESPQLTLQD